MKHNGSMLGLWIVRTNDTVSSDDMLLASVHDELYILAFTNAPRAQACTRALGAEGRAFYVLAANVEQVVRAGRSAGAHGFIVDYDAELGTVRLGARAAREQQRGRPRLKIQPRCRGCPDSP